MADFDLRRLPRACYDDPYSTFRAMRQSDSVCRTPDGSLFLTRYAELRSGAGNAGSGLGCDDVL